MERKDGWSGHASGKDDRAGKDDVWSWVADDLASERVTDAVRRWLEGMESAIATAISDREI